MTFRYNRTYVVGSHIIVFSILTILLLDLDSHITLVQALGTNATNTTTNNGSEASPVTIVMPAGSSTNFSVDGYEPDPVTVSPGGAIVWDNQDDALHTASGDPETAVLDNMFDTGYLTSNQQREPITMPTEPGEYTYFCTLHPFLTGTVIIQ